MIKFEGFCLHVLGGEVTNNKKSDPDYIFSSLYNQDHVSYYPTELAERNPQKGRIGQIVILFKEISFEIVKYK